MRHKLAVARSSAQTMWGVEIMNPVEIKAILDEIEASGARFRGKNNKFLESMKDLVKEGRYASSKQQAWLRDLYDQATGGGRYQKKERI